MQVAEEMGISKVGSCIKLGESDNILGKIKILKFFLVFIDDDSFVYIYVPEIK